MPDKTADSQPPAPNESTPGSGWVRRAALSWRWYHFYFILALFDVLVIVASFALYHRMLTSYELALQGLSSLETKQGWITQVQRTVMRLNAPGNDIFESRDVPAERARFDQSQAELHLLLHREAELGISLDRLEEHVVKMIAQEQAIFDEFENITGAEMSQQRERQLLSAATVSMAAMDRHQANALEALAVIVKGLQEQETQLLAVYGRQLKRGASFEKYFLAIVGLILIGVFWYGRKLQRLHDRMLESHQRALAERQERLAAVGEVCSSVAHGIRNPLAAITSSAQLALEFGTLDDGTKLRLKDVLAEGLRLDRRVGRLIDFSRGGDPVAIPYDVRDMVQRAIHEVRPNLENRNIELETEFDQKPLMVRGNPEAMTQGMIELLANSMDYLAPGGHLRVSCARGPRGTNRAEINVIDDGPGIPKELHTKVFDLFFTTKAQGNGIGLASVRRTIEAHDGRVSVIDGAPRGTHIQALLPLCTDL